MSSSKTRFRPFRSVTPAASGPVASCARRRAYPVLYLSRQPNSYFRGWVHTCPCLDAGDKEGCGAEWSGVKRTRLMLLELGTPLSRSHGRTFGNNDGPHPRPSAVETNSVPAMQVCLRFAAYGWRAVLRLAARACASRRFRIPPHVGSANVRVWACEGAAGGGRAMHRRIHVCSRPSSLEASLETITEDGQTPRGGARTLSRRPMGAEGGVGVYCHRPARSYTLSLHYARAAEVNVDAGIDLLRASLLRFASHFTLRGADPHPSEWTILSLCPQPISLLRPLARALTFHRDVDSEVHAHLALYPLRP
ncbi:hypothetical protein MSAN_00134400 [Mycena sanguinolenta]|uniref:Uncharacterized protein n=1 Tax=Mycena sanguinolenta TaxID=230812 RepID=A0A8H6ZDV0_9AGAR|nr:hypothetical protein MSAN_00134400 [Mycena sanguinolenta]